MQVSILGATSEGNSGSYLTHSALAGMVENRWVGFLGAHCSPSEAVAVGPITRALTSKALTSLSFLAQKEMSCEKQG